MKLSIYFGINDKEVCITNFSETPLYFSQILIAF